MLSLLALWAVQAIAAGIEPLRASLTPGEDGYTLSAQFAVDLGPRFEEMVSHGVPLVFNLEFTLSRERWYWLDEHITGFVNSYRLSYNALTRQYRLSIGGLHQNFDNLQDALQVLGYIGARTVAGKSELKPGRTYRAALRLSLDKGQLPKPFQLDAFANREWAIDAEVLRWEFTVPEEAK